MRFFSPEDIAGLLLQISACLTEVAWHSIALRDSRQEDPQTVSADLDLAKKRAGRLLEEIRSATRTKWLVEIDRELREKHHSPLSLEAILECAQKDTADDDEANRLETFCNVYATVTRILEGRITRQARQGNLLALGLLV